MAIMMALVRAATSLIYPMRIMLMPKLRVGSCPDGDNWMWHWIIFNEMMCSAPHIILISMMLTNLKVMKKNWYDILMLITSQNKAFTISMDVASDALSVGSTYLYAQYAFEIGRVQSHLRLQMIGHSMLIIMYATLITRFHFVFFVPGKIYRILFTEIPSLDQEIRSLHQEFREWKKEHSYYADFVIKEE